MKQSFVTVFQTNYFSNGFLLIEILFVLAGLIVALLVWFSGKRPPSTAKMIFLGFWMAIWFIVFVLALGTLILDGYKYTKALANGRCDIVEGAVLLIREQPKSGPRAWLQSPRRATFNTTGGYKAAQQAFLAPPSTNAPGDLVKIGDKEFVLDFYSMGLGYQRTAVHGGVLTNGAYVRLHYLGNTIVKVEMREQ